MDEKIKLVRIILLDVDGVLTDGRIILGKNEELKFFNAHDGMGISIAQKAGLKVGIITGRKSEAVTKRAIELKIDCIYQDCKHKLDILEKILKKEDLEYKDVCYVGDDIIDIPMLRKVGFSATVSDAPNIVKSESDYVSHCAGGRGAVRDIVEHILKNKGILDSTIELMVEEWSI